MSDIEDLEDILIEDIELEDPEPQPTAHKDGIGAEDVVRSHITILCSALGGTDKTSRQYVLGIEALACLKDLKRWIRTVDDYSNTWIVSAACSDTGLVPNDLVPIVCQWELESRSAKSRPHMNSILLLCLELLVALTKPLVLEETAPPAKLAMYSKLKKSQVAYKNKILHYSHGATLKGIIRLALPILRTPKQQRTSRDTITLNLCLHLFRNVLRIEPESASTSRKSSSKKTQLSDNFPLGVTADDININTVLEVFEKNKVLSFIQTVVAGLSGEFDGQVLGPVCLDCVYYLTLGVEPEKLVVGGAASEAHAKNSLGGLLSREKILKQRVMGNTMTRHANFGTLISLNTGDHDKVTLTGKNLSINQDPLKLLDDGKTWSARHVLRSNRNESLKSDFDSKDRAHFRHRTRTIDSTGVPVLRRFADSFLATGFNTLFQTLRRIIQGENNTLSAFAMYRYYQTLIWALRYSRVNREAAQEKVDPVHLAGTAESLNPETYYIVVRAMAANLELREWNMLHAAMVAMNEILQFAFSLSILTPENFPGEDVDTFRDAGVELLQKVFMADQVSASTLAQVPRDAHRVSVRFASDATEYVYTLLKIIARLKQNGIAGEDDYIKGKRLALLSSTERKLFDNRVINTVMSIFARYEEIDEPEFRRCLSYFFKVLKQPDGFPQLGRLDFMLLLHDIALADLFSTHSKTMRELEVFTETFMKKLEKRVATVESWWLELPFATKVASNHFLETGDPTVSYSGKQPAIREKEFIDPDLPLARKLQILVAYFTERDERDVVVWLRDQMKTASEQQDTEQAVHHEIQFNFSAFRSSVRTGAMGLLLHTLGLKMNFMRGMVWNFRYTDLASAVERLNTALDTDFDGSAGDYLRKVDAEDRAEAREENTYAYLSDSEEDDVVPRAWQEADDLDRMEAALTSRERRLPVGKAHKKGTTRPPKRKRPSKHRQPNNLPMHEISDDETARPAASQHVVVSAERVFDSDDESDAERDAQLFARDQRLHEIIVQNGNKALTPNELREMLQLAKSMTHSVAVEVESETLAEPDGVEFGSSQVSGPQRQDTANGSGDSDLETGSSQELANGGRSLRVGPPNLETDSQSKEPNGEGAFAANLEASATEGTPNQSEHSEREAGDSPIRSKRRRLMIESDSE